MRSWFSPIAFGALIALAAPATHAAGKVCNVRQFGARGDGSTKDTAALQRAIDECGKGATQGGSTADLPRVEIPEGTFVTGPLLLRSHLVLHLSRGATLLGSPDHADFPRKTEFKAPGYQALITATGADDTAITGEGTLDGNGKSWWDAVRGTKDAGLLGSENTRPRGIVFDHCHHVRIEGVTVKDMAYWQIVPYYSDDVVIRNVRITADPHSPNTDAIDPFSSSHVVIDHVFADVGDDNIAIKSGMVNSPGPDAPSRDITITDCEFLHGHGISIGSELAGGAQNIRVERVHFRGTDNGVRIKANRDRGNDVGNIVFRDITMEDVKVSVLISEYYPKTLPEGEVAIEPVGRLTPHFHDITVESLRSTGSGWAGVVVGLPEAPVKNVLFKNVHIQAKRGMTMAYAEVSEQDLDVQSTDGKEAVLVMPTAKLARR